ncbi:MAG TPA: PhzF family phenazine biosynthesis protein [Phenylobacterium sp.]|nr:PhzF family phenazine biosynthesis protein [Phenylobacterium sp.]
MPRLDYVHVDVFSPEPFCGNSLPVFLNSGGLSQAQMLKIARELRQFEVVFLEPTARPDTVRARIFDLIEELPFAGHPILGAAAVLHHSSGQESAQTWRFELPDRELSVVTRRTRQGYSGVLDQGRPEFLGEVADRAAVARAFGLDVADLRSDLPLEVGSTGLRYLVIPLCAGALDRARVAHDLTDLLAGHAAQFAVLLDEAAVEIRHWNNDGVMEDIATGSAAGVVGAYRLKHGLARSGEEVAIRQGRFVGRPSRILVTAQAEGGAVANVKVGGDVAMVGGGFLDLEAPDPAGDQS